MTPYLDDGDVRLYHGDAIDTLATLPKGSVDCCITSPPYYGLRDYGVDGQIGLEDTPEAFIERLVDVFRGVRRVLSPTGVCWVNIGDSYAQGHGGSSTMGGGVNLRKAARGEAVQRERDEVDVASWSNRDATPRNIVPGTKPKDLLMMPARLALALQADGWWIRSDVIWSKLNPMPESVTDRPTSAHEHVFLLTKSPRYWYDAEAVKEPGGNWGTRDRTHSKHNGEAFRAAGQTPHHGLTDGDASAGRNARNVWTIATQPTPDAHFATFPEELVRRCLLAGCPEQVCRECGEPRRRITETTYENPGNRTTNGPRSVERRHETAGFNQRLEKRVTTTGWSDCGHSAYRPGVVLDPFIGSGTVAKVARDHGRHAIGIDLNPDYLDIAARRTQQLGLLTGEAA